MEIYFWILQIMGGLAVLGSYGFFFPKLSETILWANLPPRIHWVYGISIFLAGIAYLLYLYWVWNTKYRIPWMIYVCSFVFFLTASLWAPSMYYFPKQKEWTVLFLTGTSISVAGLMATFFLTHPLPWLPLISIFYLFMHCFLLDNIVWSHSYLSRV